MMTMTSTATMTINTFRFVRLFICMLGRSKGLQILEKGAFSVIRQIGAIRSTRVSAIAIAWFLSIKEEELVAVLFGDTGKEPNVPGIVNVIATVEEPYALFFGLEQFPQSRNRSIVQIGRAQPDSIEGRIGITRLLAKVAEALGIRRREAPVLLITSIESALVDGQDPGIGVEARPIGADLLARYNRADQFVRLWRVMAKRRLLCAVASSAVFLVNLLALHCQGAINLIG